MPNPSNLYAEKIFSEHPTVMWALDDDATYVSLINEDDRDLSGWQISGAIIEPTTEFIDEPFQGSIVNKISALGTQSDIGTISIISPNSIGNNGIFFKNLNEDLATFTISASIFSPNTYLKSIDFGYRYFDALSDDYIEDVKNINVSFSNQWLFISETFNVPSDDSKLEIVIKLNYINTAEDLSSYVFYINGLAVGQWSEEFNSISLGNSLFAIPSDVLGPDKLGVRASAYGFEDADAYYLAQNNALLAKNSGIPMVYGAASSTILYPGSNLPSLILPARGALTNLSKNKEYSLEMWLRINSDSPVSKKIFGNIRSSDGLYVDGPFLKLQIRDVVGSYSVGQWSRPMLLAIKISPSSASLNINGEDVITLDLSESESEYISSFSNGLDNDWLAFWAYDDIYPIEVDAVAIYPYIISNIVSKRRWVYGQGVEFPENINQSYSGTSVFVDFPFAKYTNTYSYPDIGKWNQATIDNLQNVKNRLSIPQYTIPSASFSQSSESDWKVANSLIQNEDVSFFTLKPNSSWISQGYVSIDSANIINQSARAIFGTFKVKQPSQESQVLIRIEDSVTSNYLSIEVQNQTINYIFKYGQSETVLYTTSAITESFVGEQFSVGIDITSFSNYFGSTVATFFGNRNALRIYIGGTKEFTKTFAGNVYSIGMSTDRNFASIKTLFNSRGVPIEYENVFDQYNEEILYDAGSSYFGSYLDEDGNRNLIDKSFWQYVLDGGTPFSFASVRLREHSASFNLIPKNDIGFYLDIATSSYWEDYLPLTYFGKFVEDANGDSYYGIDFIQFNIDYPAPSKYKEITESGAWTYNQLQAEYSSPTQKPYSVLANPLATGFDNYLDLKNKSVKNYAFDTTDSMLKSYISFQYLRSGANSTDISFSKIEPANKNGTVQPGEDWLTTKYEVVDNMVIYLPPNIDFNDIAIVTHLEINSESIINYPLQVKSLQYASRALGFNSSNGIGTRFGTEIYPYKKLGFYTDYKSRNPMTIYRSSSPYLYMDNNFGISLKGDFGRFDQRGISIPINQSKSNNFKMIALQAAIRYYQDFFPYIPTQIFEIEAKNTLLKFYLIASHPGGRRARIYCVNAQTGKIENGIAFFINGKRVKDATINIKEWNFVGIAFANSIDFSNSVGSFKISGPITFNTVSYYQATTLQEVQFVETRPWIDIKLSDTIPLDWYFWYLDYIWDDVLVISSREYYGVDPQKIYEAYTGTNKIIVDDLEPLRFGSYEYRVHNGLVWKTLTTVSA